MKVTKIRMKSGCQQSNNVLEISQIYIEGCLNPGWFYKADIYDYLMNHPNSIYVGISPYPFLVPAKSIYGEKYVRSEADNTTRDNLLKLPRVY